MIIGRINRKDQDCNDRVKKIKERRNEMTNNPSAFVKCDVSDMDVIYKKFISFALEDNLIQKQRMIEDYMSNVIISPELMSLLLSKQTYDYDVYRFISRYQVLNKDQIKHKGFMYAGNAVELCIFQELPDDFIIKNANNIAPIYLLQYNDYFKLNDVNKQIFIDKLGLEQLIRLGVIEAKDNSIMDLVSNGKYVSTRLKSNIKSNPKVYSEELELFIRLGD